MKTYISLLRGINVSGQKLIRMDALRKLYEKLGFEDVRSYVQSGNVVFRGEDLDLYRLKQTITQEIKRAFDFEIPVIVMTIDDLKLTIDNNPFFFGSHQRAYFFIPDYFGLTTRSVRSRDHRKQKTRERSPLFF
jgi:uncharacterized protein (DUF1697 family)